MIRVIIFGDPFFIIYIFIYNENKQNNMRTVLIGSDFMYDKDGNLKPIEINTAVGWDNTSKVDNY